MALEQVPVVLTVAAVDLQTPGALLAGDDVHGGRESGDCHGAAGNAGHVVSRDAQLQLPGGEQPRGDVLQLQRRQGGELLVDPFEDVVVKIPRLVELLLAAGFFVLLAPVVRLAELSAVGLHEGNLVHRLRAQALDDVVQRRQHAEHAVDVLFAKVQLRRLLERLVPSLVPQNRNAYQLQGHNLRLLHKERRVLPQVIQHHHRGGPSRGALRFARHEQRIQQRLRVLPAHAHEQLVNQRSHRRRVAVNPRDNLRDHREPRVDGDVTETLHERHLHLGRRAVVKPQRQQPQDVLERAALALLLPDASERDGPKKAGDGRRDVPVGQRRRDPLVMLHRRRVEQRPVVPRLGPAVARVRGGPERREDVRQRGVVHVVGDGPTPLAQPEKRPGDEFRVWSRARAHVGRGAHSPASGGWISRKRRGKSDRRRGRCRVFNNGKGKRAGVVVVVVVAVLASRARESV